MEEQTLIFGAPKTIISNDDVTITFPSDGGYVAFRFEDSAKSGKDWETILKTSVILPAKAEKTFHARMNINSLSSRDSYARSLTKSFGKELPWTILLSDACAEMDRIAKEALGRDCKTCEDIEDEPVSFVIDGILEKDCANVFFGKGGSGKTFLSIRLALSLAGGFPCMGLNVKEKMSTIFLDYENNASTFKDRVSKLARFSHGFEQEHLKSLHYLNAKGIPLYEMKNEVKRLVQERNIGLLIIDSTALACGGAPESAENAIRYFNTINSLGITTLSIAHQSKADAGNYIFGSIFFQNAARNVWNVQNNDQEQEMNIIHGALIHRKCNDGRLLSPKGVRIYFGPDGVDISYESAYRYTTEMSMPARLLEFLKDGPKTKEEILEEFSDKNPAQIKSRLTEMRRDGRLENPERGVWKKAGQIARAPEVAKPLEGGQVRVDEEIFD